LWYDDYVVGGSPVTEDLLNVLTYSTGIDANDKSFRTKFPFVAQPHAGDADCTSPLASATSNPPVFKTTSMGISAENVAFATTAYISNFPNPVDESTTLKIELEKEGMYTVQILNVQGRVVSTVLNNQIVKAG